jgi:hypothetical protein
MHSSPELDKQRKLRGFIADIRGRITRVKQSREYETDKTIRDAIALLEPIIADLERDVRS